MLAAQLLLAAETSLRQSSRTKSLTGVRKAGRMN
jgi:hypothetical protein